MRPAFACGIACGADTNITFSANQSTDPIGNIKDANFTWQFTNGTLPSQPRYNITTTFNYSTAVINTRASHSFVVNLTVDVLYTLLDPRIQV